MIVEDFKICPNGYRGCDKEKLYFGTFYFIVISLVLLYFVYTMDTPLHLYESQKYDKFEKIKKKVSKKEFNEKIEYHTNMTTNEISLLGNDINIIDFFKNRKLRNSCFTGSLLSQKYNKKDLLIIGLILQGISATGIVGSYFLNFSNVLNQIILTVAIAFYFLGLSLGFGHIIWTHVFEMFPKECRVVGAFCSYYALFIGAFIMSILLEYVSMQYYSYLFITFLVSLIASVLCSGLFCQEDAVAIKRHDSIAPSEELVAP
ncbi:sugar transporter, putative [Plasmodium ovale curtisi]|uniref:Sugar transporter, putative n=1 Tax=Plasmodium ovale curtisi TaxID=864141 RepID=A0A1A8W108_PLAOA|nr:sugar transporter, putative [Plasmodium ovale curtisi]SBS94576.1 sugar transporter, putative [Plasmodium ovale curtisi]